MGVHLTAEETKSVQEALAKCRKPGTYEPGKWSVSPYNRDPRALGIVLPGSFPKTVIIRDISLRTIQQAPGVAVTRAERIALGAALVETGVPSVELSLFAWRESLEDLREEVALLKKVNPNLVVKLSGAESEEKIDAAAKIGANLVEFLFPACPGITPIYWFEPYQLFWEGKDWRKLHVPTTLDEQIERASRFIQLSKRRGLEVSAGINMLPYADDNHLEKYSRAMQEAGADQICLFDGPSGLGPEAWAYTVSVVKRAAPHCKIGVHTHNVFGLAVANALACAHAGADILEVSINGLCAASGQADLAQVVAALTILYGVDTGIQLEKMTSLARLGADISRIPLARNRPITGEEVFNWGGVELIVQELKVEPLLHWCIEPSIVGNKKKWIVDKTSGPWTMLDKLQQLGIEVDRSLVPVILQRVKDDMTIRKRAISDQEIAEIAARVKLEKG